MEKEVIFTKEDIDLIKDRDLTRRLIENPKWEEQIKEEQKELIRVYNLIIKVLKKYCDLEEKYYPLVAIWIIGTYFHKDFNSYPYLFFNAMRGSGKSRLLRLITYLSKDGDMLNSLTEAVLFRTTGTLGIDEFEGLNRKGKENLTELLNSAYKKGVKVKRFKKVKTFTGEEQQIEEFSVYRPLVIANISGMDSVLGDRCFTIILNKSCKPEIVKRIENYESDEDIHQIKEFPFKRCSYCSVDVVFKVYNRYLDYIYTTTSTTYTTYNTLNTLSTYEKDYFPLFNKLDSTNIDGRNLELAIPLLLIADFLGEEVFKELLETIKDIIQEKKSDDSIESLDISLIDYLSQEIEKDGFLSVKELFFNFKSYVSINEDWFNEKWLGRALKRLNLVKEKKRMNYGIIVRINYNLAKEKIKMFK